jgi:hypothetical protein
MASPSRGAACRTTSAAGRRLLESNDENCLLDSIGSFDKHLKGLDIPSPFYSAPEQRVSVLASGHIQHGTGDIQARLRK